MEIRHFADSNIVVGPPGQGDEVRAIKAGILEIADLLVVNKADLPQAERTVFDLTTASHLRHRSDWQVKVLRTVATSGEGVPALVDAIEEHGRATGIGKRLKRPAHPHPGPLPPAGEGERSVAPQATDEELFAQLRRWRAAGKGVALATVVKTWGSSPRPEGSHLAVEAGGAFVGSVSGIESAVKNGSECLIVKLNTPGGLLKSTRVIVSDILESNSGCCISFSEWSSSCVSWSIYHQGGTYCNNVARNKYWSRSPCFDARRTGLDHVREGNK